MQIDGRPKHVLQKETMLGFLIIRVMHLSGTISLDVAMVSTAVTPEVRRHLCSCVGYRTKL